MKHFLNILIIGHRNIGDILHNTAVLKPLKTAYPRARLSFLTSPAGKELLENNPYVSEIFSFQKKKRRPWDRIAWIRKLRQKKFDLIINLKSGSLFPFFLGFQKKWNIRAKDKTLQSKRTTHAIDIYLNVIRQNGIPAPKEQLDMKVRTTPPEKAGIRKLLERHGCDFSAPIVVMAPFSNWHAKEWPLDRFAMLSEKLKKTFSARVIFVGGPADKPKMEKITPLPSHCLNFVGRLSLRELAALYEHAALAIGADSGPFHLAVSMGVPALALFGATSHQRARPYFEPENFVTCEKELGCNPCIPGPRYMACHVYDRTTPCMEALSFERVYEKTFRMLRFPSNLSLIRPF